MRSILTLHWNGHPWSSGRRLSMPKTITLGSSCTTNQKPLWCCSAPQKANLTPYIGHWWQGEWASSTMGSRLPLAHASWYCVFTNYYFLHWCVSDAIITSVWNVDRPLVLSVEYSCNELADLSYNFQMNVVFCCCFKMFHVVLSLCSVLRSKNHICPLSDSVRVSEQHQCLSDLRPQHGFSTVVDEYKPLWSFC